MLDTFQFFRLLQGADGSHSAKRNDAALTKSLVTSEYLRNDNDLLLSGTKLDSFISPPLTNSYSEDVQFVNDTQSLIYDAHSPLLSPRTL